MERLVVAVKGMITCERRVLLVQRSHTDEIDPDVWECAGGKIEFGEMLEDALRREIGEETGLSVIVNRLLYAVSFRPCTDKQVVLLAYHCSAQTTNVKLSEEHQSFLWADETKTRKLLPSSIKADFDRNKVWDILFQDSPKQALHGIL